MKKVKVNVKDIERIIEQTEQIFKEYQTFSPFQKVNCKTPMLIGSIQGVLDFYLGK